MVFAATYMLLGVEHLQCLEPEMSRFMNAFFFSIHTLTTVGYGNVYPRGMGANLVAAIEAATGLMVFAIATGLLYGRFSRPSARILFSDHLLVAPYQDGTSLQFRITNARSNVLMDLEARVLLMTVDPVDGQLKRDFVDLHLDDCASDRRRESVIRKDGSGPGQNQHRNPDSHPRIRRHFQPDGARTVLLQAR